MTVLAVHPGLARDRDCRRQLAEHSALALIPLAGILVRIRVEEAKLADALGQDYIDYAAGTSRLIPRLW